MWISTTNTIPASATLESTISGHQNIGSLHLWASIDIHGIIGVSLSLIGKVMK
ncbi:unnamed protein product [Penicillium roqueforti FM164]|uniref:Genomic scaffold, ProqFM164S02 n=1 Tax=Penicillium roqueforti (strain FM164) TaxID=1365484 RepID=W6Q3B5_PENRF|nr:unnamed protein product [Penicillium roqueforti FM164]